MKHNILKTIFGTMMLSFMFMSFECGDDDDMTPIEPSTTFVLDNHTYDTLRITLTATESGRAGKRFDVRPFSKYMFETEIKNEPYRDEIELLTDYLDGWDTVRVIVKGTEKLKFSGPSFDGADDERTFFNRNAWEYFEHRNDYEQSRYTYKIMKADFE